MDTLILFSGAGDSEKGADGDRFTLNLANTDARWPASEFVYERKGGDGWKLVQGGDKGVKTGWVDYVRASMEVSQGDIFFQHTLSHSVPRAFTSEQTQLGRLSPLFMLNAPLSSYFPLFTDPPRPILLLILAPASLP